jgi:hypothetical protein
MEWTVGIENVRGAQGKDQDVGWQAHLRRRPHLAHPAHVLLLVHPCVKYQGLEFARSRELGLRRGAVLLVQLRANLDEPPLALLAPRSRDTFALA